MEIKTMKLDPKVFEEAAARIECCEAYHKTGQPHPTYHDGSIYCCIAIYRSSPWSDEHMYLSFFKEIMEPLHHHGLWWKTYGYSSRIIALQLAACVLRDEQKIKK